MIYYLSATFFERVSKTLFQGTIFELWLEGIYGTLIMSLGAAALGLILGAIVALVKINAKKNKIFKPFAVICDTYTTVIRGTPVALQLFIMYFAVFAIRGFPVLIIAIITFGINSGAYVAENLRAGIQSIDIGQTEAGRSLGLTSSQTMSSIILPQAFKNVVPTIGNELIALIKETSIVSLIGIMDITHTAKLLGSRNADFFVPMLCAAAFYLIIVYGLTLVIKAIERRLSRSDRG